MADRMHTPPEVREKRRHRRTRLEVEVNLHSEHNFFTGFTENISSGGLFIATHDYLDVGSRLSFLFTVPGSSEPVEAVGEVVWVRPYNPTTPDISPGMGLRFLDLKPEHAELINRFIREREPLFYDADL